LGYNFKYSNFDNAIVNLDKWHFDTNHIMAVIL
jgi:hypothetical protein